MVQAERWSPEQYDKFRDERMQPFFDIVQLIQPRPGMRVIDLGCGTGELTAMLAERLPGATVEGIDASPDMLAKAAARAGERVSFRQQDIATVTDYSAYDLVFSNAALQWVPGNEQVMERICGTLRPGAQVAIQLPKNENHPSHLLAAEVGAQPAFAAKLGGFIRRSEALELERYAGILNAHGFRGAICIEKIYGHELARSSDVVEWVKGTSLNAYLSRLDPGDQPAFVDAYRTQLLGVIGDHAPYFYPFRRALFWGMKQA